MPFPSLSPCPSPSGYIITCSRSQVHRYGHATYIQCGFSHRTKSQRSVHPKRAEHREQARAQTFWGAGAQTQKKGTQCQKKILTELKH